MAESSNSYPLSVIAGLFNTTEVKVQELAQAGIIPKPDKGKYDLVASVRSYISYLRDKPKTELTQVEIARHLDMSERNARDVLNFLKIDWKTQSLDEIRTAYIRDLREKAAGRGGDNQDELTRARIRDLNLSGDERELRMLEKAGELLSVKDFEPYLITMVTAAKQELLTLPTKISHYVKSMHGVVMDLAVIEEVVHDALSQLSTNLQSIIEEVDTASDSSVETAD